MEVPTNNAVGIIVMGPSGCGKSEVGQALANYFMCEFLDGDSFHTAKNIAKMQSGTPLTDTDRFDWLKILGQEIDKSFRFSTKNDNESQHNMIVKVVAGCSALRKIYRDMLREQTFKIIFVFLDCSQELLEQRMRARKGHFMKVNMLESQLKTLEKPGVEELAVTIKLEKNEDMTVIVDLITSKLKKLDSESQN